MRFTDIRHQDRAIAALRRALRNDRLHHALLFEGPEGVGKERTARALAARLQCADADLAPDADACGRCGPCRLAAADTHPDLHLIHRGLNKLHPERRVRQTKGLHLTVDIVRTFLIDVAGTKPTQGARRVFIIRDAERMNDAAQNALLKTLEEPPGRTTLILISSAASRLLPTIRSRAQSVVFNALPDAFVSEALQHDAKLTPREAEALAALCGGSLGAALQQHREGVLDLLPALHATLSALPTGEVEAFGKSLVEMASGLARRVERGDVDESPGESDEEDSDDRPASPSRKEVDADALRSALKRIFGLIAARYAAAAAVAVGGPERGGGVLAPAGPAPTGLDAGLRLAARAEAAARAEMLLDRNVAPQLVCERLAIALLDAAAIEV